MIDNDSVKSSGSEGDDEFDMKYVNGHSASVEMQGTLCKWTNYIHGWQDRFIVVKDSTLSYYKSANDTSYGCRGAISLREAQVTAHEFDECRFDVSVHDCTWYLRATGGPEERAKWMESIETFKSDSASSLRRHGSKMSLTSIASSNSFRAAGRGLREKLAEIETFRDILCRQVDTLQGYFDTCAEHVNGPDPLDDDDDDVPPAYGDDTSVVKNRVAELRAAHASHSVDFKGEALTFRATTAGILETLQHCLELMSQREDSWRSRLEKEKDKRRHVEDAYKTLLARTREAEKSQATTRGPDFEEGPYSAINEDEFFDAVDAALDKQDAVEQRIRESVSRRMFAPPPSENELIVRIDRKNPLWEEIDRITRQHVEDHLSGLESKPPLSSICDNDIKVESGNWQLLCEEGELKVYKREVEHDGIVLDPLKAVHTVKGITGHEMCHYFYDLKYRSDWDHSVEETKVVDRIADDTVVQHQVHKRVWPATARDSVFWSHMRSVSSDQRNLWVVCNYSTQHPRAPNTSCVRVKMNVALVCETVITPPDHDGAEITRDNLSCKITYAANVNPGGWAPASVLRQVFKREYPKFLKRFTQYVRDMSRGKPILY